MTPTDQKQLIDAIARAAFGWPNDGSRRSYAPGELPGMVARLRVKAFKADQPAPIESFPAVIAATRAPVLDDTDQPAPTEIGPLSPGCAVAECLLSGGHLGDCVKAEPAHLAPNEKPQPESNQGQGPTSRPKR